MNFSPKSKMIVIAGKSGVGKTSFAINLSHALSGFKKSILFFDGDLGSNNVITHLGVPTKSGLNSVLKDQKTLNQIVYKNDKGNFDIISEQPGSLSLASVSQGRLQILNEDLNILSANYDHIVLDTSGNNPKPIRSFFSKSPNIILLCTDEPGSLVESYDFLRLVGEKSPFSNINVIINKANSLQEGQRTYNTLLKACSSFLESEPSLLGVVREDTRIRDATKNQTTIISRYPTSDAAIDIINITRKLLRIL